MLEQSCIILVPLAGIEPASQASEARILSIEIQGL